VERYSLQDAQDHLKKLLDDAQQGLTVVIVDEKNRAVQLVPIAAAPKPRKAGSARGQITMADNFDAPLSDFDEYMP
jgi:antitoxin (DNA-binding transcriptional repressor) of toxin-antitoxin stability system